MPKLLTREKMVYEVAVAMCDKWANGNLKLSREHLVEEYGEKAADQFLAQFDRFLDENDPVEMLQEVVEEQLDTEDDDYSVWCVIPDSSIKEYYYAKSVADIEEALGNEGGFTFEGDGYGNAEAYRMNSDEYIRVIKDDVELDILVSKYLDTEFMQEAEPHFIGYYIEDSDEDPVNGEFQGR